eukprot:GAFH01003666.1.p2 GENE.GAFH01003666.1~~GAFH01003666.1.p2  ORF type:complete len:154 (+),score=39.37 GAFH01003666.1:47-508(+)
MQLLGPRVEAGRGVHHIQQGGCGPGELLQGGAGPRAAGVEGHQVLVAEHPRGDALAPAQQLPQGGRGGLLEVAGLQDGHTLPGQLLGHREPVLPAGARQGQHQDVLVGGWWAGAPRDGDRLAARLGGLRRQLGQVHQRRLGRGLGRWRGRGPG